MVINSGKRSWKQLPAELRRRQILDAGAVLLQTRGFEAMTMAELARAAKLAKGSLYLHFDSKQALLAGLQQDLLAQLLEHLQPLLEVSDERTLSQRLDQLVADWFEFQLPQAYLFHVLFHENGVGDDGAFEPLEQLLGELLRRGQQAGEFELLHRGLTARFLLGACRSICAYEIGPGPHALQRAQQVLQLLFRRAVGRTA